MKPILPQFPKHEAYTKVQRDGRLTTQYEFKPLTVDKLEKLGIESDKPMTLADAMNINNSTTRSLDDKPKTSFGFV